MGREDADFFTVFSQPFELHDAVDLGKNREIFAESDVDSRVDLRADLPHDDVSRTDELAAVTFYAAPLTVAISTVSCTTASFFCRHGYSSIPVI